MPSKIHAMSGCNHMQMRIFERLFSLLGQHNRAQALVLGLDFSSGSKAQVTFHTDLLPKGTDRGLHGKVQVHKL